MFAECTIEYDTKKEGDICVFVEKQILVLIDFSETYNKWLKCQKAFL